MNKQELIKNLKFFGDSCPDNDRNKGLRQCLLIAIGAIENLEESKKVVIPQFVADWYEENEDGLEFEIFKLVNTLSEKDYYELTELEAWFNNFGNEPIETVVKMKLFGYEVEKERLYRVEMPGTNDLLLTLEGNEYYFDEPLDYVEERPSIRQEFTESEIKAIDERYWQFAMEVEELENE